MLWIATLVLLYSKCLLYWLRIRPHFDWRDCQPISPLWSKPHNKSCSEAFIQQRTGILAGIPLTYASLSAGFVNFRASISTIFDGIVWICFRSMLWTRPPGWFPTPSLSKIFTVESSHSIQWPEVGLTCDTKWHWLTYRMIETTWYSAVFCVLSVSFTFLWWSTTLCVPTVLSFPSGTLKVKRTKSWLWSFNLVWTFAPSLSSPLFLHSSHV